MTIVLVFKETFMYTKDRLMRILGQLLFRKQWKIGNFIQVIILTMITVSGLHCCCRLRMWRVFVIFKTAYFLSSSVLEIYLCSDLISNWMNLIGFLHSTIIYVELLILDHYTIPNPLRILSRTRTKNNISVFISRNHSFDHFCFSEKRSICAVSHNWIAQK